jgi:hypothetical protein
MISGKIAPLFDLFGFLMLMGEKRSSRPGICMVFISLPLFFLALS